MQVQHNISNTLIVSKASNLSGSLSVPGDKSITHRAIILSSISNTTVLVKKYLAAEDCINTINTMQSLGVNIKIIKDSLLISGVGLYGLQKPKGKIYLGNSGTALRLLTGILSAQTFSTTVYGDSSLNSRPMQRIIAPLTLMGAKISATKDNYAPLEIKPAKLTSIKYTLPLASAQVKSAVLFAALYTNNKTTIIDNFNTRDHSERMLKYLLPYLVDCKDGASNVSVDNDNIAQTVESNSNNRLLKQFNGDANLVIDVPGDISSAAFFIVAALITKNSNITIKNVGINPTRTGVIDILLAMGADITFVNKQEINNEPRADICVKSSALNGVKIGDQNLGKSNINLDLANHKVNIGREVIPRSIDEFPIIFIAAACANGSTVITGLDELKHKESDRLNCMLENLKILGVDIQAYKDGVKIIGGNVISGGQVDSFGDHRIAMSLAIAALVAKEPIIIKNCSNIVTSFPNFVTILQSFGVKVG